MNDQRMLLRVGLESFKSIARLDELELGQLTVVVGENSAGKSSLLQAVVMMSQIARSDEVGSDVPLYGDDLDLGDFKDVVHSGTASDEITVALTIRELPLAENDLQAPDDDGFAAPLGEFRWEVSMGVPYRRHRRASIRRLTLSTSVTDEVLSASTVDPRSTDPGEQSSARELRSLLARSIRLARAGSDPSLELAARSAFGQPDAPLFEGGVRPLGRPDDEFARTQLRLPYIEVSGGLPALALRARGNKGAAARAFANLAMPGPDFILKDGDRAIVAEVKSVGRSGEPTEMLLDDNIYLAFAKWYESLDEALRQRESFRLPKPDVVLDDSIGLTASDLLNELALADTPGVSERDQLERFDTGVTGAAELVQDALARRIRLLGPLRDDPSPTYLSGVLGTGITPLGKKGQFTVAYLDEHENDRVVCPLLADDENPSAPTEDERSLKSAVDYWLDKLGIAQRGKIARLGRNLEFELIDRKTGMGRDLTAMGVGASQVLPVVVLCLAAGPGDLVLLEQPELHLHPGPQQRLGDFLLGIARTGRQLLVESHSEYLVNRIRRRMVEQRLDEDPDSLKLLYATRGDLGATTFQELRPNALGAFEGGWPEGFFDQSPDEAEKIVRAAAERRRAERATEK